MLLVNLAGILGVVKLARGNGFEGRGQRKRMGNDITLLGGLGHGERE